MSVVVRPYHRVLLHHETGYSRLQEPVKTFFDPKLNSVTMPASKSFQNFLRESAIALQEGVAKDLEPHPLSSMKDEGEKGLDWEYNREYVQLCKNKGKFGHAFDSREHFGQEYKKAEVRHLTPKEHHNLDYSEHTNFIPHRKGEDRLDDVDDRMGHRRDVHRIANDIKTGSTAYPIVIKHSGGLRILAGNTRMSAAAAMGKHLPVKIMDISDRH